MKRVRENSSTDGSQIDNESSSPKKPKLDQEIDDEASALQVAPSDEQLDKQRVFNVLKYQEYKEEPTAFVVSDLREKSVATIEKVIEKSHQRKSKKEELKKTGRIRKQIDRMTEFEENIRAANATKEKQQPAMGNDEPETEIIDLDEEEPSQMSISDQTTQSLSETQITDEMNDDDEFETVDQMDENALLTEDHLLQTVQFDENNEEEEQEGEDENNKTFIIETEIPDENGEIKASVKSEKPKRTRKNVVKRKTKDERQADLEVYKLSLLTFFAYNLRRNELADNPLIQGLIYSMIPETIHKLITTPSKQEQNKTNKKRSPKPAPTNDVYLVQQLVKWFKKSFEINTPDIEEEDYRKPGISHINNFTYQTTAENLISSIESKSLSDSDSFIVFLSMLRSLGLSCRQVCAINPDEYQKLEQKQKEKESGNKTKEKKEEKKVKKKKPKKRTSNHHSSDEEVDEYIEETKKKKKKQSPAKVETDSKPKLSHNEIWIELFSETQNMWMRVDPDLQEQQNIVQSVMSSFQFKKPSSSPSKETSSSLPVIVREYPSFVLAFGRENAYIQDITFNHYISKAKDTISGHEQFDEASSWFKKTISAFTSNEKYEELPTPERSNIEEEHEKIKKIAEDLLKALPKNQDAYKSHPLYIIEKWVNRYEALYPPNPPVVGKCGKHDVFSRSHLHLLHTKDRWIKDHGLEVKEGEKPYKIVKASHLSSGANCELYGEWQTQPYQPPVAQDGIVPKNERGQVDLWHERMLPVGTVHLNLRGVALVARKLKIDYAPAMTGFEVRARRSVPKIEGIVICKEYEDVLRDAYVENQRIRLERLKKRKELRIRKNWRKLVLRLLAREDINSRFGHLLKSEEEKEQNRKKNKSVKQEDQAAASQSIVPSDDEEEDLLEDQTQNEDEQQSTQTKVVNGVMVEFESL